MSKTCTDASDWRFCAHSRLLVGENNDFHIFVCMDQRTVLNIAKQYKRAVINAIGPAKVYLFGSYSKGCVRPDSDIDIAVVVPRVEGDYLSTAASLWRITMDVNTLIEPVLIEEVYPSPLYENILQTGIVI